MRLATILALLPASALAQNVGRFPPQVATVPYNVIAADMGRCVLQRDRQRAVASVDLDPGTPAFRRLARDIEPAMIACLKGARSATISPFYLQGSIAEALLHENDSALLKVAQVRPATMPVRVVGGGDDATAAAMACAVAADPADAGAMMAADASTPTEIAAFRKLVPALQACVPASGGVKLPQATVRPNVAVALYRLGRKAAATATNNGVN